jgi:crossover junction endodeoxyribonuclease RuvC
VSTRVLGIDPGTAVTGYGLVVPAGGRVGQLLECGVLRTDARRPLPDRLRQVYEGVCELIERLEPTVLALEGVFYAKNVRTTVTLGHTRGVILLAAARASLAVAEFPPATVKKAIAGAGGAGKAQVGHMVQRMLNLSEAPTPADAADGVAIALTYLLVRRSAR